MAGVDDIIGGWVKEAEKTGEVKRLPGYGKPLDLDEDRHVPAKYRTAYRVLKNAGYAPPEVQAIQRLAELKAQLEAAADSVERARLRDEISATRQALDVALDKFRPAG